MLFLSASQRSVSFSFYLCGLRIRIPSPDPEIPLMSHTKSFCPFSTVNLILWLSKDDDLGMHPRALIDHSLSATFVASPDVQ
jgi:hypothetical protein